MKPGDARASRDAIDWFAVARDREAELRRRGLAADVVFSQQECDQLVAMTIRRDAAEALVFAQALATRRSHR